MKIFFKLYTLILLTIFMSACSDNVKRYKADPSLRNQVKMFNFKKIELGSVTMPNGDDTSTLCRMNGSITLPDKMKYSEYVRDALQKSVDYINEGNVSSDSHKISVVLKDVSVNTFSAKWNIDADVTVDNHSPVSLNTVTEHSFSFIAPTACNNASKAFDEAVDNFIKQLLINPIIAKQLQ